MNTSISIQEMMEKALEIAKSDMQNIGITREQMLEEFNALTEEELANYIEENQE